MSNNLVPPIWFIAYSGGVNCAANSPNVNIVTRIGNLYSNLFLLIITYIKGIINTKLIIIVGVVHCPKYVIAYFIDYIIACTVPKLESHPACLYLFPGANMLIAKQTTVNISEVNTLYLSLFCFVNVYMVNITNIIVDIKAVT